MSAPIWVCVAMLRTPAWTATAADETLAMSKVERVLTGPEWSAGRKVSTVDAFGALGLLDGVQPAGLERERYVAGRAGELVLCRPVPVPGLDCHGGVVEAFLGLVDLVVVADLKDVGVVLAGQGGR